MKIGIVIAMDKEFDRIRSLIDDATQIPRGTMMFVTGRMGRNEVVMTQCGIGKVNAAMGATLLADGFAPDIIVSTGVAGGVSTLLNVREVVVSTATCYHDVYCGEELTYGQIPQMPARFAVDHALVEKAVAIGGDTRITPGLIVTGDWFVDSREKMRCIAERFPDAMAVDMESAAIAHVCFRHGIKFISFRIISDIPLKDDKARQYFDFWERMADESFGVTKAFLESI